jgi:hypothetical protein
MGADSSVRADDDEILDWRLRENGKVREVIYQMVGNHGHVRRCPVRSARDPSFHSPVGRPA